MANFFPIVRCQDIFLDNIGKLGDNIARNKALKENVFMMVVCIELRIPLFLVGKPGSSKSLAKTIVGNGMLGKSSTSELFKTMKSVRFYLRGSESACFVFVLEILNGDQSLKSAVCNMMLPFGAV